MFALIKPLVPSLSSPAFKPLTSVTDKPHSAIICSFFTRIIVSELTETPEVTLVKIQLAVSSIELRINVNSVFSGTFNGSITLIFTGPPSVS